jgi:hypothetical protein
MFDDAARASKANPPFRADGANAHVIWRIEKADDPGRDMPWIITATIGRPALRCVCKRRRALMIDRRRFLIGAQTLLTASFVNRASAFSRTADEPLILPPVRKPEETLYVYLQDCAFDEKDEVAEYDAKWRVSLGPDQPFASPPPSWRSPFAWAYPRDG